MEFAHKQRELNQAIEEKDAELQRGRKRMLVKGPRGPSKKLRRGGVGKARPVPACLAVSVGLPRT